MTFLSSVLGQLACYEWNSYPRRPFETIAHHRLSGFCYSCILQGRQAGKTVKRFYTASESLEERKIQSPFSFTFEVSWHLQADGQGSSEMRKRLSWSSDPSTVLDQAFQRLTLSFSSSVLKPLTWALTSPTSHLPVTSIYFCLNGVIFLVTVMSSSLGAVQYLLVLPLVS